MEKELKKWVNASKNLSFLVVPAFAWFVIGGLGSAESTKSNSEAYYPIIGVMACSLILIQFLINFRKPWSIIPFALLIPINLLGSVLGWISLGIMLFYWKKMIYLMKNGVTTKALKSGAYLITGPSLSKKE